MVTRYEYFDSRNNRWNPYDPATCAFLESAEQANPNAIVQLQGLPFQVRFGQNARSQKMVSSTGILQVNVNTENSRDVRRVAPMQPQQQQTVQVQVPPNAFPGMHVQARIPDGRTIDVPIPTGVMPGQVISVAVPAQAPPMMPRLQNPGAAQPNTLQMPALGGPVMPQMPTMQRGNPQMPAMPGQYARPQHAGDGVFFHL